jgi:hypothetical protein
MEPKNCFHSGENKIKKSCLRITRSAYLKLNMIWQNAREEILGAHF